jgi:hypothetical protein
MSRKVAPVGPKSRLQRWLDSNALTSADLEAVTGIDRRSMTKIRADKQNVTRRTMLRILEGARTLARRQVHILELFDLNSDDAPPPIA